MLKYISLEHGDMQNALPQFISVFDYPHHNAAWYIYYTTINPNVPMIN